MNRTLFTYINNLLLVPTLSLFTALIIYFLPKGTGIYFLENLSFLGLECHYTQASTKLSHVFFFFLLSLWVHQRKLCSQRHHKWSAFKSCSFEKQ
ncbi:hypothetical protein BD560DRAFT_404167 [Blakeslea trispora]|nr:hypothetical protein BD560DRAFT_404167 [Blakeslea trispora]